MELLPTKLIFSNSGHDTPPYKDQQLALVPCLLMGLTL
ncbi:hypothetical protein BVRB_6g142480 [Beta vulgaris subsp. vulgaris]|nr:hypothetical protein BVRB_6g142480 [Beta vulgaris subsp. vulgaris]